MANKSVGLQHGTRSHRHLPSRTAMRAEPHSPRGLSGPPSLAALRGGRWADR